jgi:hypothetical protein
MPSPFLCPTSGRPTELYCSLCKTKLKTKLPQPKRATFKDLQDPVLNEWESALVEAKAALLRSGTLEAHAVQLRIQREMSGEQRILLEFEMSLFARELAREGIRRDHPEWREPQVARELSRLAFLPNPLPHWLESASRTLDRQPFAPVPSPPL